MEEIKNSEVLLGEGEIVEVAPKKKLFISCPMKGRTEESIKRSIDMMHKIAEAYFDQELERIDTYITDNSPEKANPGLWYLGRSFMLLSEADYFIGVEMTEVFKGCNFESLAVKHYCDIPAKHVSIYDLMPDAVKIQDELLKKDRRNAD